MATCKTCGSNFHACSSCMLSYDYEYRYCNEKCWRASEEYKEAKAAFKRLYDSVPDKKLLADVIDEVLFDDDYINEIESWMQE